MSENIENRRSEKGFTLIELIVVLVILGLLASVVGYQIMNKVREAKSRVAKIQITELEGALTAYSLDMGHEPSTAEGLEALIRNPGSDSWNGPYLAKYEVLPPDPWQHAYQYRCPGQHGDYDIYSFGPDGTDGTDDDVCSWKQ
jgi:general secretion pathway protein G